MVKKKVDSRIRNLIENGVQTNQRSFFIVVGDNAKNQLPNLHLLLNSASSNKLNKNILWAYKNKLVGFTSHRKKRETKMRKEIKQGKREVGQQDPFELFIGTQNIRYVYYKETEKILGNTYGMLILQDFEAITPNILARTIETVEGGGLVVLMLKSMTSLKQLYTMSMDVYSRYRTEAHTDVVARFNERFLLSLQSLNKNSLIIDDEMNVLPALGERDIERLPPPEDSDVESAKQMELRGIKDALEGVEPAQSLVNLAKTTDQAKAILQFIDSIAEKTLRNTVALTAGRGRGKSAALGLAIAAAVAHGYSNIFITSPSPENLNTLFEFIFKGFDALGYVDHMDYDILKSTNPAFNDAIVRVNVFKSHRQTIQYIQPSDAHVLGQAELVVIDEAAAIPLPLVKKLLGPYLVFMASTINGYEGTGRSLSLKLIQQLKSESGAPSKEGIARRSLKEVSLDEPIRYAPGDPLEQWLNSLLCLDATVNSPKLISQGLPDPSQCSLYYVNRDALFSYHSVPERFLHKLMALYVASHYKNSPNDLQLMSDAPAHHLFVLLKDNDGSKDNRMPEPLCVIQVALEGQISKASVLSSLGRGVRAGGDLIPWVVSQQFQDSEFAGLSGARVVRIATSPEYMGMGYGTRALKLLQDYYEGKFTSLSEDAKAPKLDINRVKDKDLENADLHRDVLKLREKLPPLLVRLSQRPPEFLHYLGVSYGLTNELFKFWNRSKFAPVYLRQTANDLTGEHTCVMLKVLEGREDAWLGAFATDFHRRFLQLLSFDFNKFPAVQCYNVIESATRQAGMKKSKFTKQDLDRFFSPFDLKRLESYGNNLVDYHVVMDLLPVIALLYFGGKLDVTLKRFEDAFLLGVSLQKKSLETMASELGVKVEQALPALTKICKRMSKYFRAVESEAISETMPELRDIEVEEMENNRVKLTRDEEEEEDVEMDGEEEEEEAEVNEKTRELKEKQKELINSLDLDKYAIATDNVDDASLKKAAKTSGKISIKSNKERKRKETVDDILQQELGSRSKKQKKAKK
ncbi:RNA cytidine acetyltransferase [Trichomonascus vanleenenianus]|uniref:ribosome biosynthesis protein KRE33 n=1 Tax=Trichomonascus vanleenenianus TaxID=2268995 RepID=UPI003EC9FB9B